MKTKNVILLFLLTLVSAVVITVEVAWAAWLNVPVTSSLRKEVDASIAIRGNTVYAVWIEGNSRLFFRK